MHRVLHFRPVAYATLVVLALASAAYVTIHSLFSHTSSSPLSLRSCTDPALAQAPQNDQRALYVNCGGFLE